MLAPCILVVCPLALASDKFWNNPSGGTFSSSANWVDIPFQLDVPGSNDVANFGMTSNTGTFFVQRIYTVGFTSNPTNQRLVIEDDFVTFDLDGHVYITTSASPSPIILGTVAGRSGRLTIKDGNVAVTSADTSLALGNAGTGFLTVTTGGLLAGSAMDILMGGAGGTLAVEGGGDVIVEDVRVGITTSSSSTSTATITGGGSTLLTTQLSVGFAGMGTLDVTAGGDVESSSGVIGAISTATGIVTVDGNGSTWDAGPLTVGRSGVGRLDIEAGGLVESTSATLGDEASGVGTVTVDGTLGNSRWINSGSLTIGGFGVGAGEGRLDIKAGGLVESASGQLGSDRESMGTVNVDGANSRWFNTGGLIVGKGNSALNITRGGRVENSDGLIIASTGTNPNLAAVKVDGDGSQWINRARLTVAGFGKGTLEITDRGSVSSAGGIIGGISGDSTADGTVTVDGDESLWSSFGELVVGNGGAGKLMITDGGAVDSAGGTIGAEPGGSGKVLVDGDNSLWVTGSLVVGHFGHGELNITGGGRVFSHTAEIAPGSSSASGLVVVAGDGSQLILGGRLGIGVNGFIGEKGQGTLRIQTGGLVTVAQDTVLGDDDVLLLEGGALRTSEISFVEANEPFFWTSGTLHLGIYDGDLTVPNGGVFQPTAQPGSSHTRILGDYTQQAGATLAIEIGGTVVGQFDAIFVNGNAFLDGNLRLTLLNGVIPSTATNIFIATCGGSMSGAFDNAANGQRLTTNDGLGSFIVNYGPSSPFTDFDIVLSGFQRAGEFTADFDDDGDVDGADLAQWEGDFGVNALSDADDDGDSDGADLLAWQRQVGSAATATNAAGVPEPGAAVLAACALAALGVASRVRACRSPS